MSGSYRERYMRLMVFFDMPMLTAAQRRRYAQFRKFLVKDGYLMVQKSVYSKLVINDAAVAGAIGRLQENRPAEGLVQVLKVTEKQYATMTCIVGNSPDRDEMDTSDELVVL